MRFALFFQILLCGARPVANLFYVLLNDNKKVILHFLDFIFLGPFLKFLARTRVF
jgi:hypothetical protein